MDIDGRIGRIMRDVIALGALLIGGAGCFLPIRYREPASPLIVGSLTRSDGTPAAGARVVVARGDRKSACARPTAAATADTEGRFRLEATTLVRRGILLMPPVERFANGYTLCVGADSALRVAYEGAVSLRSRTTPVDSLACVEWTWREAARASCAGPTWILGQEPAVQTVEGWSDGAASGFYRLIVQGRGFDRRRAAVFLQWVERSATGAPERVRQTIALPLVPNLTELKRASLSRAAGEPACVTVHSDGLTTSWTLRTNKQRVALQLGAPGETRAVKRCTGDDTLGSR